jgi:hypothetical protein
MNNTNAIFLAIGVAAILAVVIAPALVDYGSARKEEQCTLPSGNPCTGATADQNPQVDKKCVAGSKLQENANCP